MTNTSLANLAFNAIDTIAPNASPEHRARLVKGVIREARDKGYPVINISVDVEPNDEGTDDRLDLYSVFVQTDNPDDDYALFVQIAKAYQ